MKKRYIIGLGNYSRGDDGIGLRVIEYICENNLDKAFTAFESGNDILKILSYFDEAIERIVFVDCTFMGKKPGEYMVFGIEDVETKKITDSFSTHEGDILKMLELAKSLNYYIPDIRIVGIEPQNIGDNMELSPVLRRNIAEYANIAINTVLS